MVYKAARGSILTDEQAQCYGEHIATTFGNGHVEVTAEDIIEDARSQLSPTHEFFEWDDTEAAAQYRLQQAKYMLRSIHIVVETHEQEIETRAFVNVRVTEPEPERKRVYMNVQHALSEEQIKEQVIDEALRQLDAWRARWSGYTELAGLFAAIEQAREQLALELVTV